eukprot:4969811-Amphidinium_carterae.1
MQTRNKLAPTWGGDSYRATRGIAQGCPLSTLLANTILQLVLPPPCPEVTFSMYLDDTVIMSRSREALAGATAHVLEQFKLLGLQVNEKKSTFVGFGHLSEDDVRDFAISELRLPLVRRTTMLGFDLHTENVDGATDGQRKRSEEAQARLARVAKLPGGASYKQKVLNLMVSSLWRWAPLGQKPHASTRDGLRRKVTCTLLGKIPRSQSHEVLYAALWKGHLLDPSWTQTQSTLVLAWKLLHSHPHTRVLMEHEPPPGTLFHDLDLMLASTGMTRDGPKLIGMTSTIDITDYADASALAHAARAWYREHLLAQVEQRRPREFEGLSEGVNYEWLHKFEASIHDPLRLSVFRRYTTGSFLCKERQHRHSKFQIAPLCMVCDGIETISHIVRSCVRHSFAYHREYLDSLSALSAERIAKNGIPLLTEDVRAGGYEKWAFYMGSVLAALQQRDVDNAHIIVQTQPCQSQSQVGHVRRRLRGKQRPPLGPSQTASVRRRLRGKQPRPVAYGSDGTLTAPRARVYNTAVNRVLASVAFDDQGEWHINGHTIVRRGEEAECTLVCTRCHRSKLWRWRHLWANSPCNGERHKRAMTSPGWSDKPAHISADLVTKRLTCLACESTCALKHILRFVTKHAGCV